MLSVLVRILVDSRHDWPTNGSALAILQYTHMSMQESELFTSLEANSIEGVLQGFVDRCKSREAKRHIYEALTILEICKRKLRSIE